MTPEESTVLTFGQGCMYFEIDSLNIFEKEPSTNTAKCL